MTRTHQPTRPITLLLLWAFVSSLLLAACHGNPNAPILDDGGYADASDLPGPWSPPGVTGAGAQDTPRRFGTIVNANPAVLVNSTSLGGWTATTDGVNVAAGETVSIKLVDSAGVRLWQLSTVGTDERVAPPTITQASVVTGTATFVAPAAGSPAGWALVIRSQIGVTALGNDSTGKNNPAYSTTFGVYLPTSNSYRVGAVNETVEGNSAFGWVAKFNPLLRANIATGSAVGTDRTLATTGLLQGGGNLSTDRTISVVPGTNGQVAVTAAGVPSWGFISNTNIASGAAIDLAKLSQTSAATGQAITWNGSQWAPGAVIGTSGATCAVADLAALRAVVAASRTDNQSCTVGSPLSVWTFSSGTGAGFPDDGNATTGGTVIKPTDVLLASNGRWYQPGPVVPTIAALRLAVSGKQATIQVQAYSSLGDTGGGIFDLDTTDSTSSDNTGTIVVAGTNRYKRRYSGALYAAWFGVRADGIQLTTATRTGASAHLTYGSNVFSAAMAGRKALVREPSSLATGTMTIAGGGSFNGSCTGCNAAAQLPAITGSPVPYQPASGGAIYINGTYFAVNYVDATVSPQVFTFYAINATETAQPWYAETETATTVSAFNSATDLTLGASATLTQSGNTHVTIATDDADAFELAVNTAFTLGVRELVMPSGLMGIGRNVGFTGKSNLTIRWPSPEGSAIVDLRKISSETPYPNATNYYGAISFYNCDAIHIVGGSYDANVPVIGVVHSAGGSVNNSGSRSGFSMISCTNSSYENCRSAGYGARDEHLYVQGTSRNFLIDHARVVGNNNVSLNFNGTGSGDDDVRITNSWASGILLGSASFVVDNNHITTNGDARLTGGITVGNVGHGVISNNILHDINLLSAGLSLIDVFGGNNADSSLSIRGNKLVHNNGLWDSGHGAPIKVNNHGGTVSIEDNVIDKNTAYPSAGRFINILGASLGKVQIGGTNVLRGRAGSLMTIGVEVESGVPAGAVTIDDGIYYGESITTRWIFGNTGGKGRLDSSTTISATGTTALELATDIAIVTANGSVTVTLPDPTKCAGHQIVVKNDTTQAGTTTVGTAAGNIDGSATTSLVGVSVATIVISDGTNWKVLTGFSVGGGGVPSTRTLTAGAGLTGGGDLSANRTFDVVAANSTITVNADSIQVGTGIPVASLAAGGTANRVVLTTDGTNMTMGQVNLASAQVTGTLPAGNQAAQTLAGDVTGTTAADTVVQLTGTAGSVAVPSGNLLTWASSGPIFGARPGTAADAMIKVGTANSNIILYDNGNIIGFFNYNGGSPLFQQFNGTGFRLISTNGDLTLTASSAATNVLINPANATKATFKSDGSARFGDASAPSLGGGTSFEIAQSQIYHEGAFFSIKGSAVFPTWQHQNPASGNNGSDWAHIAQAGVGTDKSGGNYIAQGGGSTGAGIPGGVVLKEGSGGALLQVVSLAGSGSASTSGVISLGRKTALTTTQVPNGDGLVYLGDITTGATSNPVSGSLLWSEAGKPAWRTTAGNIVRWDGISRSTASAGGGGTVPATADEYMEIVYNGNIRRIPLFHLWSPSVDGLPANDNGVECEPWQRECAGWR